MKQHKRNVNGMHKAIQQKRIDAINRVMKVLEEASAYHQAVTFSRISKLANVSKAWLYRQADIRSRIDELRLRHITPKPSIHHATESKNLVIVTLKNRIKKLEYENTELRKQLEIAYGELHLGHKK